jgi:hypothetical protein
MIDDQIILTAERLRDDLAVLKKSLREKYDSGSRPVTSEALKAAAARLAETWMVNLATRPELADAIASDYLADLNVRFQRLLTFSEHATKRDRYEGEIGAILKGFTTNLVIPLKQQKNADSLGPPQREGFVATAFVGHSFADADKPIATAVLDTLAAIGVTTQTGEKPKADTISEKVKRLIEGQHLFVGVFSRRDKITGKKEWTTSPWVIDEKAYAVGKQKRLILIKEQGVGSIGGIQGDYEFIEFSREALQSLVVRLLQVFDVAATGLRT